MSRVIVPPERLSPRQKLRGHLQTLRPFFSRSLRPLARPATQHWSYEFVDDEVGPVELSGRFLERSPASLVIVLHGLGGSTDSGYMALALQAAERADRSCLLFNCRGADRRGADIYHSGLSHDIARALESPIFDRAQTIDVLGYSIGGHIALRYATRKVDPRVRRVAAVGAPLDLSAAADDFDGGPFNVYRGHVMDALKEIYTAAYQRNPRGIEPHLARRIQKIRVWDERIIAPRFGFSSAAEYYEKESVGPRLGELQRDALYVGAVCDPMVQTRSVLPFASAPRLRVVWDERSGHLGFPDDFDMGMPGLPGVESQVFSWFEQG